MVLGSKSMGWKGFSAANRLFFLVRQTPPFSCVSCAFVRAGTSAPETGLAAEIFGLDQIGSNYPCLQLSERSVTPVLLFCSFSTHSVQKWPGGSNCFSVGKICESYLVLACGSAV